MSPTSHLDGRVVVITGGAGGFGSLLASSAASRGAHVVCSDVDAEGLDTVVAAVTAEGGSATAVPADVAKLADMHALVKQAVDTHGAVDVMINNAGIMPLGFISDHEAAADAWSLCIDINMKGVLHGMIAVHDQMVAQGRGHVVNLSSIYGNHPVAGAAVYGATKAAVNWMSEAFRIETQGKIKVTIVRPTGVPGTGLGAGIINPAALSGILGQNTPDYLAKLGSLFDGTAQPGETDPDNVAYAALSPEYLTGEIIHAIDQPWGVSIGDITVRATGDAYLA